MTALEYKTKIDELMVRFFFTIHDEIVDLTNKFHKTSPTWKFDEVFPSSGSLDQMAFTRAWIEDKLNGISKYDKKSRNAKINNALGY